MVVAIDGFIMMNDRRFLALLWLICGIHVDLCIGIHFLGGA